MKQTKNTTKNELPLKKKVLYIALFILSIYSVSCFQQLCYSKDDARYWYHKGNSKFDSRKYGAAKICYNTAIDKNPNYEEAYLKRGEVYFKLAQYENAISDFTKVIALNPKNAEAYINRGDVYYNLENFYKAISDYTMSINLNPKNIKVYAYRGSSYRRLNLKDKAIEDYRRGCELGDFNACTSLKLFSK